MLRAPARRGDALPARAGCRFGGLSIFRGGVRRLTRHRDGSVTYFLPAYERRTATGHDGLAVCVATLTPAATRARVRGRLRRVRYYERTGGCFSGERASALWFNSGARTVAAVPDGVARVRLRLDGEQADREVAVRRNAMVLDGSAPVSWTWLGADGAAVTRESAPFVCED